MKLRINDVEAAKRGLEIRSTAEEVQSTDGQSRGCLRMTQAANMSSRRSNDGLLPAVQRANGHGHMQVEIEVGRVRAVEQREVSVCGHVGLGESDGQAWERIAEGPCCVLATVGVDEEF